MKRFLIWFAPIVLFLSSCGTNSSVTQQSSTADGSLQVSIDIQQIGTLAKKTEVNTISLSMLCLVLSCNNNVYIQDSIPLEGNSQIIIKRDYKFLTASEKWHISVWTIDAQGAIIHSGSKDFSIKPTETTSLAMKLNSLFSMVRAKIESIPQNVSRCELSIDDQAVAYKNVTVGSEALLEYDYVSTSAIHKVKIVLSSTNNGALFPLYSGDTILYVVPGQNKKIFMTLKQLWGTGSIDLTLENVGLIEINASTETPGSGLPFPFSKDGHTIALYHFEDLSTDVLYDECGKFNGVLMGAKKVSGYVGTGVALSAGKYASLNTLVPNNTPSGTAEFFFKINESFDPSGIYSLFGNRGSRFHVLYMSGSLVFQKNHSGIFKHVIVPVNLVPGVWYRIAVTWGTKGMRMYMNNELIGSNGDTSDYQNAIDGYYTVDYFLLQLGHKEWCCMEGIGIPREDGPFYFDGVIDELMVSDIERY
jgi:hypothetical protein